MKSIARKDFIAIGSIQKTHGTKGDLRVTLTAEIPKAKGLKQLTEWAFLEIQGKPVPFIAERFEPTFDDEALLKLKGIDSIETANKYIGYTLLAARGKGKKAKVYAEDDFTGYKLIDTTLGEIGTVESIEEYPHQLLIKTTHKGNEVLIPAVEAFIEEIDDSKRIIKLHLPEGLVEE
jgi:16S rRNA processing protein RimM